MTSIFGFRDPVHHDPEEAAAIRTAVADLLDGRTTLTKIAAEWNRLGLRRRRNADRPWDASLVYQALTGDRIGGVVRRNKQIVDEPPTWLPIITMSQWIGLQTVLRDRDLRSNFSYNRQHLARGIAHCFCGSDLHHLGGGNRRRYVCATRTSFYNSRARDGLRHVQIADHLLDGALREAALDLMNKHGTDLVSYLPRSVSDLSKALGAANIAVERARASTDDDAALRVREAEHHAADLEAERDDRMLWEALVGLNNTNSTTLAESWDRAPLEVRHTILRRTITATVDPGRGHERIRVETLLS